MKRIKLTGRVVVWIGLLAIQLSAWAQDFNPKFKKFGNAEGLSQSVVLSIFQDSKGFLWFGTEDGLNKFDGYSFKVYRYDPEDSSSISDNWIQRIHIEDRDGDIWMETSDHTINVFSPKTNRFVKIQASEKSTRILLYRHLLFIKQDNSGLIWISTERGLFTIDKNSWKVKQVFVNTDKENPRIFTCLLDDNENNVWVGSNNGVLIWNNSSNVNDQKRISEIHPGSAIMGFQKINNLFYIITDKEIIAQRNQVNIYKTYNFGSLLSNAEINKNEVQVRGPFARVKKDSKDNLWICTKKGLVYFNVSSEKIKVFLSERNNKNTLSSNVITSFYEDKQGNNWIGTSKGLNRFVPENNEFLRIAQNSNSNANSIIDAIYEDKSGKIWASNQAERNEGANLFYYDNIVNQLVQVKKKNHDPEALPTDLVYQPFKDHDDNLWFGSYGFGAFLYSPNQKKFDRIKPLPGSNNALAGSSIWGITEDKQKRLWIALFQDGLDCYDRNTGTITHYKNRIESFTGTKNLIIIAVACDNDNNIWIGTMGQGVIRMDATSGKMTRYQTGENSRNYISSNFVLAITKDKNGKLLLSYTDNGLDILDPNTGKLVNYKNIPGNNNSLVNNSVRYAIGTSDGNYWISTDGAITFLNAATNQMTHYISRKEGGKGILSDKASCIYEDSKGNIWVGTHGGGLSLFDRKKNEFKYWVEKSGLANNVVYGILEDNENHLWLSTNNGLSRFDPVKSTFVNYYINDGLQASEFNANSFYKAKNGKLFFGGINGITTFFPSDIRPDAVPPRVAITGFQIFNKKVEVLPFNKRKLLKQEDQSNLIVENGHLYLPQDISYTNKLQLSYNYKVFTFEFAALRFDMPERCTFKYKMEGFENEWNIAGHRKFATYTNLPPGRYTFLVKAANADGIENTEPVKLEITIKPPFYLTWWFISFGVGLLIIASTSYVMNREKDLKKAKVILEEKVHRRTQELNEKNEELTLRNIQILKQKEEIANQAKRLSDELNSQNSTSEQALLRSQINPHFLFNTLNNIYSLVYQKSHNAPQAVMMLSDIMRYMLYDTSSDQVLLEKEIKYLRSFIELQQLRLKNKDFVQFEVNGDPSNKQIAPMLLIPFVENAFKHGNKSSVSSGIFIKLNCYDEKITFIVKNQKNLSATKDSFGGIGLANVKRRLELIYHDKYKLDILDIDDKFEVDLMIMD